MLGRTFIVIASIVLSVVAAPLPVAAPEALSTRINVESEVATRDFVVEIAEDPFPGAGYEQPAEVARALSTASPKVARQTSVDVGDFHEEH